MQHSFNSPLFRKASEQFGGTVDVENLGEHKAIYMLAATCFTTIKNSFRSKNPAFYDFLESVDVGFIFSDRPNAQAWSVGGKHFIGLTSGLVHLIYYVTQYIFSIKDAFPYIDGGELEDPIAPDTLRVGFAIDQIVRLKKAQIIAYSRERSPRSEDRHSISILSAICAFQFVILHEYAHLFFGHLAIIRDIYGLQLLTELNYDEDAVDYGLPNEAKQFFEIQADQFAVDLALRNRIFFESKMDDVELESLYGVWSLSVHLMFWLFSQLTSFESKSIQASHPHPQTRSFSAFIATNQQFERLSAAKSRRKRHANTVASRGASRGIAMLKEFWTKYDIPGSSWLWLESEHSMEQHMKWSQLMLSQVKEIRGRQAEYVNLNIYDALFLKK